MPARAASAETAGNSQERILRAALETFSENGFDGARMREIAGRAGVPLGLLQYHFGGKLRLWRAAVDRAFGQLRTGLDSVLADPHAASARERLRLLIRGHTEFVSRFPEFVRLMHDEGKRGGPRMRWMVDRHVKPMFDALVPIVEQAQAEGVLPVGIAPHHFIYVLAGAVGVIFHQAEECKRAAGFDPSDPTATDAHARAVEQLFLGSRPEEVPA